MRTAMPFEEAKVRHASAADLEDKRRAFSCDDEYSVSHRLANLKRMSAMYKGR